MRKKGSLIARDIDREYKAKKSFINYYSSICKQRTCEKCNYREYCRIYESSKGK